jgi:hypothetical protein
LRGADQLGDVLALGDSAIDVLEWGGWLHHIYDAAPAKVDSAAGSTRVFTYRGTLVRGAGLKSAAGGLAGGSE